MEKEILSLDDNISDVIRDQAKEEGQGRQALEDAQKVITNLFSQITEIKSRAEKTEDIVCL